MEKLLKYHTVSANPEFYWENNAVAIKLKSGLIKTYDEYVTACKMAGCNCYNQDVFNEWLASRPKAEPVTITPIKLNGDMANEFNDMQQDEYEGNALDHYNDNNF